MASEFIITTVSGSVDSIVDALKQNLAKRGIDLFAVIDHGAGAVKVGLELGDEVLVVFGNPTVGTKLIQESRLVGLDLPLKILVWSEGGTTNVGYSDPHALAARYDLTTSGPVLDGMAALMKSLVGELSA